MRYVTDSQRGSRETLVWLERPLPLTAGIRDTALSRARNGHPVVGATIVAYDPNVVGDWTPDHDHLTAATRATVTR